MIDICEFGAVGDGLTLNTEAINRAVDCAEKTGDTVYVPAGVFLSGTIVLKNTSLYLESGAVLKASGNIDDYPYQPYHHNEMGQLRAFIVGLDCQNVTIEGRGTIDFSGHEFYDFNSWYIPEGVELTQEQIHECPHRYEVRPGQSLFFHNSQNIVVRGITVLDAPCWTLTFSECENVKLQGLTIDTSLNIPNDDGIHISACKGVIISDCNISSGDDCIALSSITNWEKPCEDIVITNCVLRSCSKAIVIGYQYSIVRNVLISNCIIKESNRGLCVMCNDEHALVENVRVNNMIIDTRVRAGNWWGNGEPLLMMALKHDGIIPSEQEPSTKTDCAIRNVHLSGLSCMGENTMGIYGENNNIRQVTLKDVDYVRKPSANLGVKGYIIDLAPSSVKCPVPADCGLYIEGAEVAYDNINLNGLKTICK